jgi:hypothetical protein
LRPPCAFAYSIRKLVSLNETLATGDKLALQREDNMRRARSHTPPTVITSRSLWTRWDDLAEAETAHAREPAVFGLASA